MPGVDGRIVAAFAGDVFAVLKSEGVVAIGPKEGGVERCGDVIAYFLPPSHGGGHISERAPFHLNSRGKILPLPEVGLFGGYSEHCGRGVEFSALEHVVGVADGKREHPHVVEREAAYVDLSGLAVAHGGAVVANGSVGRAHVSDRHCFQSADSSIVFHIGAGKASHGVGHVADSEVGNVGRRQCLHRHGSGNLVWGAP